MLLYKYGMRLREFGIGCQPNGFKNFKHCSKGLAGYWSYVWYSEKLSEKELSQYSMDYLGFDQVGHV